MKVTSMTPMLRVIKESAMIYEEEYIAIGDRIKVINHDGDIVEGIYFDYEIGCVEEEDILEVLLDNDIIIKIYESKILNIVKV